jgi:hypothetical protein
MAERLQIVDDPENPKYAIDSDNRSDLIRFVMEERIFGDGKSILEIPIKEDEKVEPNTLLPFEEFGFDSLFRVMIDTHLLDGTQRVTNRDYIEYPFGLKDLKFYKGDFDWVYLPIPKKTKNVDPLLFRRLVTDHAANMLRDKGCILITLPNDNLLDVVRKATQNRFTFSFDRRSCEGGLHAIQLVGSKN